MTPKFDIRPMVKKNSALPVERLRVVRNFEELRLSEIQRGVVFVFAAWSDTAAAALQRFTKVMRAINPGSLDLVVLDTDCLTKDSARQLFGQDGFRAGGWGETLWIRDGRVVTRGIAREGSEAFLEQHTRALLEDPATPEKKS